MTLRLDLSTAFPRAVGLTRGRAILGITGSPGAGKSTYAEELVRDLTILGHKVALVPMDGFHLSQAALDERGLGPVKGAPQTFDASGYVALLRRLRDPDDSVVWAPRFDRGLEDPIAASIPIGPDVTLVVTEGNYLLYEKGPWATVRPLLDECWYVDLDEAERHRRLEARHRRFGRTPEQAHERTMGSDETNARLIAATASRADAVLQVGDQTRMPLANASLNTTDSSPS
ncbi:nucleoside/nucleotide kinase family protein [Kribbella sp. NBC_01245]|uniref:nucleoside/nucleotide kinase family protein n=1 Tax=Kribbella sp. NBC_01245 TaxID=2903578 RepID=UPI002E2C648B|nr:nucleoside/nucleotide kinase family protein [Kribbella sp. NBC_01245]